MPIFKEYISDEEFNRDVWPQMEKAGKDLDDIIKEVISRADHMQARFQHCFCSPAWASWG